MSDLNSALLCFATYWFPSAFEKVFNVDQVWVGAKLDNGIVRLSCRGSDDLLDFYRDLESIQSIDDPDLGPVAEGFMIGIRDTLTAIEEVYPVIKYPHIEISGHSLGGAHAQLLGALFILAGYTVGIVTFGSPRPGGYKLQNALKTAQICSYRDKSDPVPLLPPPSDVSVHPVEPIEVFCPPIDHDPLFFVKGHRMLYYVVAIALLQLGINL